VEEDYAAIHKENVKLLLQFSTSHVCEQDFSCLTNIKSKDRNRLISVEDELRVCLFKYSLPFACFGHLVATENSFIESYHHLQILQMLKHKCY
jgi:hypothetical protein